MKQYNYNQLNETEKAELLKRPAISFENTLKIVKPIIEDIKVNGLSAVLNYSEKFDGFTSEEILVSIDEFNDAEKNLNQNVKDAIKIAFENIKKFHIQQLRDGYSVETVPGVKCFREYRAIENVGIYIPGGSAPLPSTTLMLGIPAMLAGCKRIVAISPSSDGKINDAILYAAKLCEITEFYKVGGAQAIAMLAFGCKEIQKVDKIFGPGNQYVTAAKILSSIDPEGCTIDMPAGPSEVLVIADDSANAEFIASDLLSQAEHGADSQAILVTTSQTLAENVSIEVEKQLSILPRKDIASKALESSFILVVKNLEECITYSNLYAPEHLIVNIENPSEIIKKIQNAGSVFLGSYTPESAGDYASGTNHSLPTYGYAKSISGVCVDMFQKAITFQQITKNGINDIGNTIITLAETEGLQAHANAVKIRMQK